MIVLERKSDADQAVTPATPMYTHVGRLVSELQLFLFVLFIHLSDAVLVEL